MLTVHLILVLLFRQRFLQLAKSVSYSYVYLNVWSSCRRLPWTFLHINKISHWNTFIFIWTLSVLILCIYWHHFNLHYAFSVSSLCSIKAVGLITVLKKLTFTAEGIQCIKILYKTNRKFSLRSKICFVYQKHS